MYFAERPTASHPTPPEDKDEAVGTHPTPTLVKIIIKQEKHGTCHETSQFPTILNSYFCSVALNVASYF